jgi:hypothetical protein
MYRTAVKDVQNHFATVSEFMERLDQQAGGVSPEDMKKMEVGIHCFILMLLWTFICCFHVFRVLPRALKNKVAELNS